MTNKIWTTVGKSEQRIDAVEKATGKVKYVGDYAVPGLMHAKLVTSTEAHALIKTSIRPKPGKLLEFVQL